MIRRFARVDAPVAAVVDLYRDVERWPEWRPSIAAIEVLERGDDRVVVRIDQAIQGRRVELRMRYTFRPDGFTEHQLSGFARKWDAEWHFQPAPAGEGAGGTVVGLEVEIDMGFLGFILSRRAVRNTVERMFDATAREASARLRRRPAAAAAVAAPREGHPSRIRILRTDSGLEVWLDDRRYIALPAD